MGAARLRRPPPRPNVRIARHITLWQSQIGPSYGAYLRVISRSLEVRWRLLGGLRRARTSEMAEGGSDRTFRSNGGGAPQPRCALLVEGFFPRRDTPPGAGPMQPPFLHISR